MIVALAKWQWDANAFIPSWRAPAGARRALDLRSHSSIVVGGEGGFGLFELETDPGNVVILGDDPAGLVGPARKQELETALGVTLDAHRLGPMIFEAVTRKADPTGQATRPKGLHPGSDRKVRLNFGGHSVARDVDLKDPDFANVLTVLRQDYKRARAAVVNGVAAPRLHRRMLGYWLKQYRTTDYRQIQHREPDEEPDEPASTVTDSFDRANSSDLNAVDTGKSPTGWNWTEASGDWAIQSNQLVMSSGSGDRYARCDFDLSSDDHYSQVVNVTIGTASGVTARHSSADETLYLFYRTGTTHALYRANAAVYTLLSDGGDTRANGDTLKIEVNGSVIKAYRNGVQDATIGDHTDASPITGNVRCGLYGNTSTVHNDFEAADLDVVAAATRRFVVNGRPGMGLLVNGRPR